MGNISEAEYKKEAKILQKKIADLSRTEPVKTKSFEKGWKEVYEMLDDEHKRSFWRGLIKEVKINEDAEPVEIIY